MPTLTKADVKHIIDRLCRECSTKRFVLDRERAEAMYEASGSIYNTAKRAILKARMEFERECEKQRAEREAEGFAQIILRETYRRNVQPQLQAWAKWPVHLGEFDPLNNPAHAFRLIEELNDRKITAYVDEKRDGFYHFHIDRFGGGVWRTGVGRSDDLKEAIVIAWMGAFQQEGDGTDYGA